MGNETILINDNGCANSLQVSCLHDVPAGNFNIGRGFVIKNITDDEVTLSVRLISQTDFIDTKFYPGWNPEIIAEIEDAPSDTLQYGY